MAKNEWAYSDDVKDHFMNPRNILIDEEGYEHDGKGITGNVKCGDQMIVYIKVDKKKNIITDCKWKTFGCASAIASMSILSEIVKGMEVVNSIGTVQTGPGDRPVEPVVMESVTIRR